MHYLCIIQNMPQLRDDQQLLNQYIHTYLLEFETNHVKCVKFTKSFLEHLKANYKLQ